MDLSIYTIEELIELGHQIKDKIHSYEDGYVYICKVRSYGRNWEQKGITNKYSLQDLMYKYDGENGIVDVYTNNPNLAGVYNYGDLMFIESVEDYEKWSEYESLKKLTTSIQEELDEWDNRDNVPFKDRPNFSPIYSHEELDEYKKKLEEFDMSFVPPRRF